jgi:hypothetical protein
MNFDHDPWEKDNIYSIAVMSCAINKSSTAEDVTRNHRFTTYDPIQLSLFGMGRMLVSTLYDQKKYKRHGRTQMGKGQLRRP